MKIIPTKLAKTSVESADKGNPYAINRERGYGTIDGNESRRLEMILSKYQRQNPKPKAEGKQEASDEALDMSSSKSSYLILSNPTDTLVSRIQNLEGKVYKGSVVKIVRKEKPFIVEGDYNFLTSLAPIAFSFITTGSPETYSSLDDLKENLDHFTPDTTLLDRVSLTPEGAISVKTGNLVLSNFGHLTPLVDSPKTNIFIEGDVFDVNLAAIKTERLVNMSKAHVGDIIVPATVKYSKLVLPNKVSVVKFEEGCTVNRVQLNPKASITMLLPYSMKDSVLDFSIDE